MHLEVLVEEPSAEVALLTMLPRILPGDVTFQMHVHQGKPDLLKNLPAKLRAYSKWLPGDYGVVVLVDRDSDNCHELKAELNQVAQRAGLVSKASVKAGEAFNVLYRIAIEELEAWYFGDVAAVCAAYPRVPRTLGAKAPYREPDGIRGGTLGSARACPEASRLLQGWYAQDLGRARNLKPDGPGSQSIS